MGGFSRHLGDKIVRVGLDTGGGGEQEEGMEDDSQVSYLPEG